MYVFWHNLHQTISGQPVTDTYDDKRNWKDRRSKIQRIRLADTGHCFELTNKFDNKQCGEFE